MEIKTRFLTNIDDDVELIQQIKTLCTTYEGTIPLNRGVGLDPEVLSENIDISKEIVRADIFDKFEKYIPEVEILDVDFENIEDLSALHTVIRVERREDV